MADDTKVITLTLPDSFFKLVEAVHKQHAITVNPLEQNILSLDPGETTGWATLQDGHKIQVSQQPTKSVVQGFKWLEEQLLCQPTDHIRCEDYRVYEWKAADHSWSPVHTIRWIGAIEVLAYLERVPLTFCMAQHAKAWWTDEKLKHFGLWPTGLRHGRDALRHLLYYILFPTKVDH